VTALVILPHPRRWVLAIAAPGNLINPAHALAQFARVAAVVVVGLQKSATRGREVGRQGMQIAGIVFLAIARPAVQLLEDVEGEGID